MPHSRVLTAAEVALARRVFGDAIDYSAVAVHARGFLPFGLQHVGTSMAPDGHLYCRGPQYRADFACAGASSAVHFVHEMAHVWQHQLGYPVLLGGLLLAVRGGYAGGRAYRYEEALQRPGIALRDFNMEQQAQLIAHWAGAALLGMESWRARLPALEMVLGRFLRAPRDSALLPASLW